ncbi:hypothetical protein J7438_24180, partial [Thalassotalea sp. G20_0]|uniref:hypothetical protein n=1 Tax=Thalassotalea sp. G20_0 TaxID=2821093 RepID=UPI001ADB3E30
SRGSVRVLNLENRDFADIDKQEKGGILHFFSLLVCSKNAHVFTVITWVVISTPGRVRLC